MPPAGKRGGRGRDGGRGGGADVGGGKQAAPTGGGGSAEPAAPRRGAGRGIPDWKENPTARATGKGSGSPAQDGEGAEGGPSKFNAQEAADWMAQRYQAVVDDYDKQKASS